jgi:hypothetical protein
MLITQMQRRNHVLAQIEFELTEMSSFSPMGRRWA